MPEPTIEQMTLISRIKKCQEEFLKVERDVRAWLWEETKRIQAMPQDPERHTQGLAFALAEPERWSALARTDIQVATMKLIRAVERPQE